MEWSLLSACFVLPLLSVYFFFKWKFSYWKNRSVPYLTPTIPYGNFSGVGKVKHVNDLLTTIYSTFKNRSPLAGIYFSFSPIAVAIDLDLIKNILIKDFHIFHDRWFYSNEKDDPLSANMFALHGDRWKRIRSQLTPTFTSTKMKFMFPTVVDISRRLVDAVLEEIKMKKAMEIKDILARFTTDVVGECAFGIECNTLQNANAEFRKYSRIALGTPRHSRMVANAIKQFPKIAAKLGMKIIRDDVTEFFFRIVRETIEQREKQNIRRKDFMDLLIELKNQERSHGEENLSIEEITAQVLLFFVAGYETSSTTVSYTLYELALNPDIQNKAREEIFNVLKRYNNQLTYEALDEMQYINQIISETLRKYPIMVSISRQTTYPYRIPNTNMTLEKDTTVFIPAYAIHHDPDIYPNPGVYNPDRFNPEEERKRHPISFLAFGHGPRNCIASRFGRMETRIAMVELLQNFKFSRSDRTNVPLIIDNASSLLVTKGGMYLCVEKFNRAGKKSL